MDTRRSFHQLWERRGVHAGQLSRYIDRYVGELSERGYCQRAAQGSTRVIADFGCWLERKKLAVADIDERIVQQYHAHYRRTTGHAYLGARAALHGFLFMLRQTGVCRPIASAPVTSTPRTQLIDDFKRFLLDRRGLNPKSVELRLRLVRRFLQERCGGEALRFAALSGDNIAGFIKDLAHEHVANGHSTRYIQQLCSALRSFLRYLLFRGEVTTNLAGSVPAVANWKLATLPKFLLPDQVLRTLRHCDRRRARGKRDYAILLLLARLGLRANEVATLLLDDIDWHAGQFTIRGKGRQRAQLPLPVEVGKAIADYLQLGRPRSVSRRVFLRHNAPCVGFLDSSAVSSLAGRALRRAGVSARGKAAHLFRHTLATEMLRSGASLTEIGQLLRHKRADTTRIYAKVDLTALRTLALPWPGGVS